VSDKTNRLLCFYEKMNGEQKTIRVIISYLSLSPMQKNSQRSATDIRIWNFRKILKTNKFTTDEVMRKFLKCSRATYQRELSDYTSSVSGVIHDVNFHLIGYESDIDNAIAKFEKEKNG